VILYEYARGWGKEGEGRGVMTEWERELEREGRNAASLALLDQALDRLEQADFEELPRMIAGTLPRYPDIRKLQLGGRVRLRPLLCTGPENKREELTFLMPAFERNWIFDPKDAVEQADRRRKALLDGSRKRIVYERD
jgi:hypothetical protein